MGGTQLEKLIEHFGLQETVTIVFACGRMMQALQRSDGDRRELRVEDGNDELRRGIRDLFSLIAEQFPALFFTESHQSQTVVQPQQLNMIASAFVKATVRAPSFFLFLAKHLLQRKFTIEWDARSISNMLWSFAKGAYFPPPDESAKVGLETDPAESGEDLFRKLFLSVARRLAPAGVGATTSRTTASLTAFNNQELVNVLWAFATAKMFQSHGENVFGRFWTKAAGELGRRSGEIVDEPQDLANTMSSFARLAEHHQADREAKHDTKETILHMVQDLFVSVLLRPILQGKVTFEHTFR